MWDGLVKLLSLSTIMAIASFLAGSLPLTFSLSRKQLRFISALGTGVLVGAALIVIIPEGVETLYNANKNLKSHARARMALLRRGADSSGTSWPHMRDESPVRLRDPVTHLSRTDYPPSISVEVPLEARGEGSASEPGEDRKSGAPEDHKDEHEHDQDHEESSPHGYVGFSLILGFVLMYLIDVLPNTVSDPHAYQPLHISLTDLSRGPHRAQSPGHSPPPAEPPQGGNKASSTSIGLIIHSVADGIALGASTAGSTGSSSSLGIVVFLAIMLHKAPAAFGMTSVLLKQGVSKRTARAHLAVFSLAAPTGAVGTWLIVNVLGSGRLGGEAGMVWWTGLVLLFSGGTFLYVAMHAISETTSPHSHDEGGGTNGYVDPYGSRPEVHQHQPSKQNLTEIIITVIGMLIPLVTQVGHAH